MPHDPVTWPLSPQKTLLATASDIAAPAESLSSQLETVWRGLSAGTSQPYVSSLQKEEASWGNYMWRPWDLPASPAWYFIVTTFTARRMVQFLPISLSLPCSIPIIGLSLLFTWQMFLIQNLSMMRKPSKCLQISSFHVSQHFPEILWDFGVFVS